MITMNQNTTILEVHSALNANQADEVANAFAAFHPAILGELLRAVDIAYRKRTTHHPDYEAAVAHVAKNHGLI